MKKILIGILLAMVLIGCGGVKKYSRTEKVDLLVKIVVNEDTKAEKEYKKIRTELRKKIENGESKYQIEESEWMILSQLMKRANRTSEGVNREKFIKLDISEYIDKPKSNFSVTKQLKGETQED